MGHDRPSSLVWSRMFCEVLYLETAGFSKLWLAHLPKALQRGLRTFTVTILLVNMRRLNVLRGRLI